MSDPQPPTGAEPANPAPVGPPHRPPTCRYCGGGLTTDPEWPVIDHRVDCDNPVVLSRRARAEARRVTVVEIEP
jgi:hypothetical protein